MQGLPFGRHVHGAQELRHIQKYVEVTGTARHISDGDSPAQRINQRFLETTMRYFNVAGPCNKADHYMIDASTRLKGVEQLIDRNRYFVIHAARQSGKTTYLKDLTDRLNNEKKYYALYCSLESLQGVVESEKGIPQVVKTVKNALRFSDFPGVTGFADDADYSDFTGVLTTEFTLFCKSLDKPLVVLFDEADCLSESTLISFLRQLRMGYNNRNNTPFIHSVTLVGMRNIRDNKVKTRPESQSLGSASPFNIVAESLTLNNFTKEELSGLYRQHTEETGQRFEENAIDLIFRQTQGQPWLVNAIACEVIEKMLESNYTKPVTAESAEQAIQTIILRRDTHIDSLLERLKEERVRRVIEPVISGEDFFERLSDDYQYVRDLGLISDTDGKMEPANPIYGEVIARTLTYEMQQKLLQSKPSLDLPRYIKDGRIDMDCLLKEFQEFWRENGEIWKEKTAYREAAPQLILMAFLQRVLNGGGRIHREFAAGTGRADICVEYDGRKYPIELKIRRNEKTLAEGMEQILGYMETLGCAEGWLALFDQRKKTRWDTKLYLKKKKSGNKTVTIVGL